MTVIETLAITLIGSGALTGLVTWLTTKRNSKADRQSVEVSTYIMLIEPLEKQIVALREEVEQLRHETELCHQERDADRSRIRTLEMEVAHYKGGETASYNDED